jgi:hypothetical protein
MAEEIIEITEPYPAPAITPYNPTRHREWVRGGIAVFLLVLLAGVIAVSFYSVLTPPEQTNTALLEKVLGVIFAPLIALVSAATGFYFGSQSGRP